MNNIITTLETRTRWHIDPKHSEINFTAYQSLFIKVKGCFKEFGGAVFIEDETISGSDINLWINPNSLVTGSMLHDNYLKGADIFDTELSKVITYDGISLNRLNKEFLYESKGMLTMKNISRIVKFKVDFIGEMIDPRGRQRMGFYVKGVLNRKLWRMEHKNSFSAPGNFLSNSDVIIDAKFQFIKDL